MLSRGRISIVNEFRVEKLIYGGDGLGRIDGRVVLTPYVLPGELARVELEQEKRDLARARLVEVRSPAPERVVPACPYFTRCGGCHYQHATYEFQLEQKRAVLRDVLRRVGKIEAPEEIAIAAGPPWEYRNRAQFSIRRGRVGYHEAGSDALCAVERCPICSPRINEALAALWKMAGQRRFPGFLRSLELFTNESEVQVNARETVGHHIARSFFDWCAEMIPGASVSMLDYHGAGEIFRVGHKSFFQVNRFLIDRLVEIAMEGAEGETALDLYAGVGLFSLPLARRFGGVTAVESGAGALRDLKFNADRAGLAVTAHRNTAEGFLDSLEKAPDFVLADPPRAGLGRRVVEQLLRLRPARLTIVACDPATLARDLATLLAGYRLEGLTLVDLFPQTYHIETVARLRA